MTMTPTEERALALANEVFMERCLVPDTHAQRARNSYHEALCRAIDRADVAATRHAAEMQELKERFGEVLGVIRRKTVPQRCHDAFDELAAPFIIPAPDMVSEWLSECSDGRVSDHTMTMLRLFHHWLSEKETRKIGEAGE